MAVLHTWGSLRPWTLSGHFHETDENVLIHINEALSGLPVRVKFLSFEDAESGGLEGVDVVINAGRAGDAWSGGDAWRSAGLIAGITRFVHGGGAFIGVGEPSACGGGDTFFAMAHVLGVDADDGRYACHAKWPVGGTRALPFSVESLGLARDPHIRLVDPDTGILAAEDGAPQATLHPFGRGFGAYLSGFTYSPAAAHALLMLLCRLTGAEAGDCPISDNPAVETAWFPASRTLVALNNSDAQTALRVQWPDGGEEIALAPLEMRFVRR